MFIEHGHLIGIFLFFNGHTVAIGNTDADFRYLGGFGERCFYWTQDAFETD
jgi:hypothetical protein